MVIFTQREREREGWGKKERDGWKEGRVGVRGEPKTINLLLNQGLCFALIPPVEDTSIIYILYTMFQRFAHQSIVDGNNDSDNDDDTEVEEEEDKGQKKPKTNKNKN